MEKTIYKNYVEQIQKYPLLDKSMEIELSKRVHNGDKKALMTLIESNLRLVVSIANHYQSPKISIMDLVQEGNIALMTAAGKFSYSYSTRFSTYAYAWIQQSIIRYLRIRLSLVTIPHRKEELLRNLRQACSALGQDLSREPSEEELAAYLGIKKEFIAEIKKYDFPICSFDNEVDEETGASVSDFIQDFSFSPEKISMDEENSRLIRETLHQLPKVEYKVIFYRYNIGRDKENWTYRKIGDKLGISPETVRQAELRALRRLRHAIKQNDILSA